MLQCACCHNVLFWSCCNSVHLCVTIPCNLHIKLPQITSKNLIASSMTGLQSDDVKIMGVQWDSEYSAMPISSLNAQHFLIAGNIKLQIPRSYREWKTAQSVPEISQGWQLHKRHDIAVGHANYLNWHCSVLNNNNKNIYSFSRVFIVKRG